MPTVMRNLVVHALRSLNAIQLLIRAELECLVINEYCWHRTKINQVSRKGAKPQRKAKLGTLISANHH
jgi:hypothetical protein